MSFVSPAFAKKDVKALGNMSMNFSLSEIPETVVFQTTEDIVLPEDIVIPANSFVTAKIIQTQRQLRWHKSGFILCKLISFAPTIIENPQKISDKDFFFLIRKYEKVYAKEAVLLGTEITLTQGAAFFAPGVDILYYFTKGAFKKTTHPHWFRAGVSYAYENSIFWFCLKGKPIELDVDDEIQIKEVTEKKAVKLAKKAEKRNIKYDEKMAKKLAKKQKKELKQEQKRLEKEEKEKKKRLLSV